MSIINTNICVYIIVEGDSKAPFFNSYYTEL